MPDQNTTRQPLTAQRLRELLVYDPSAGTFLWRVSLSGGGAKRGAVAGTVEKRLGYCYIKIDQRRYLGHRLAWLYMHDRWPDDEIDHINGDPSDNRIVNLREATRAQNARNKRGPCRANTDSGVRGVFRHRNRWAARIQAKGAKVNLGTYDTIDEAADVVEAARARLFREFAGPTRHRRIEE